MRHFHQLPDREAESLFHRMPIDFTRDSAPNRLAVALGGTLYAPAVRRRLADDIANCHRDGVMSVVCCLEDAIGDDEVDAAETNLVQQVRLLAETDPDGPLLFVRVRRPDQIYRLSERFGDAIRMVSGFVLPKFLPDASGQAGVQAVQDVAATTGLPLYAMPVLESPEIAHAETRLGVLTEIRQLLDGFRDRILAVRVGVTDLSGWYGLRRPAGVTVWDVVLISRIVSDIANLMIRADGSGYYVSGPVWEYFTGGQRGADPLRPPTNLWSASIERRLPVDCPADLRARCEVPRRGHADGLIREILLDRANGLTGKTIIHPSHATTVHALSVVSHEEYCDATSILDGAQRGGVQRSAYRNKMNEVRPHLAWAESTLLRAEMFGVAAEDVTCDDLLIACEHRELVA